MTCLYTLRISSISHACRLLLAVNVQVEALAADKDAAAALEARTAEVESAAQTAATSAGLVVTGVMAVSSLVPALAPQLMNAAGPRESKLRRSQEKRNGVLQA